MYIHFADILISVERNRKHCETKITLKRSTLLYLYFLVAADRTTSTSVDFDIVTLVDTKL